MNEHPAEDRPGDEAGAPQAPSAEPSPVEPGQVEQGQFEQGPAEPPQLPRVLLDPRPVVAAGFLAWAVATGVIALVSGTDSDLLPICYAGLVIGALGTVVFLIQRRGARSGRRGAQRGLG